jgi:hypothetical protein
LDAKSPERTIAVEEQEPLITMPPSGVPSFHVPTDAGPLFDSDKETERYLERILSSVAAESPFAQISPIAEVTGKTLGLEHGGQGKRRLLPLKRFHVNSWKRGNSDNIHN